MKNTLTAAQASCLSALYFIGGLTMMGEWNAAGHSVWLSILIAAALSLPFLFVYDRIAPYLTNSKILAFLFILLALCLAAFYIRRVTVFMAACLLPNVPVFITGGLMLLFSLFFGLPGLTALGRFCRLMLPLLLLLFVLLCVIVSVSWDAFQVESFFDLKPQAMTGPLAFLSGLSPLHAGIAFFWGVFTLKGLLFIHVLKLAGGGQISAVKAAGKGLLLCAPSLSALSFLTLFALGSAMFDLLRYPVFFPFILVEAGEYVHHFELVYMTFYVLCELASLSMFFAGARVLSAKILGQLPAG